MIVAFTGKKGSGKDYAAQVLKQHDNRFECRAFVDPLKSWVKQTFQLDSERAYDEFKRKMHPIAGRCVHGRDIVRDWGMAMREANYDVFLNYMDEQVNLHQRLAITDLRFTNELWWCQRQRAVVVKIVSDNLNDDNHESELGIDDHLCDFVINNSMDSTFNQHLKQIFNQLEKPHQ